MSSQAPEAPVPAVEVKSEDVAMTDGDAPAETKVEAATEASSAVGFTKKEYEIISGIIHRLTNYKDKDGRETSKEFQRLVSKRTLPEYFDIIKEPVAFSTIRSKIVKKTYNDFKEFILDFARICHNAQVFNRPSALVYQDAIALRLLFKDELQNLVNDKVITSEEAELPDLGPLPEFVDSPQPGPEDEAEEEEDDDEEEEDEEEDTDDDRPRRGKRVKGARRSSAAITKREGKSELAEKEDPESQKKRGRPPKVHTPMEARINTILKGLRKFKHPGGDLKIIPFEKLPDKIQMPDYYVEVTNPIAMDLIKKKAKRKKYHSVDQTMKDLELMFENAKSYNVETSQIYKDAVDLQREARALAEQEKKKPDSDFVDEDGRLPLSEILHNGEVWKVGDWIHLTNPNDVTKPIVAQIYRTWQDTQGEKWINACWYYRPEQTVHRFEKHFFDNEVVKTGQYRDHKIDEVVDRCFVMFATRYFKGRPRGFPKDKEVYVCEARYNELQHKLNKIKTWASCVPDEVRDKENDYEMDLFEVPRKARKLPSTIKHLLREDAKEDDALPKPTWGAPNAPPIVGAVHKRPREANESPPPEPTPSPSPPPPEPIRRPVNSDIARPFDGQEDTHSRAPHAPDPATPAHGQTPYGQQFAAPRPSPTPIPLTHSTSYGSQGSAHASNPPTPGHYQSQPNTYNSYAPQPSPVQPTSSLLYSAYRNVQRPAATPSHSTHGNAYNPPRPIEVYTLPETANASIPPTVRAQFHTDQYGKVIFYTTPPLDVKPIPEDKKVLLGHSLRYLADNARHQEEQEKKRKARQVDLEVAAAEKMKRLKADSDGNKKRIADQQQTTLKNWTSEMEEETDRLFMELHGEDWKQIRELSMNQLAVNQEQAFMKQKTILEHEKEKLEQRTVKIEGFKWI